MDHFKSKLVSGHKTPYSSWTFVVVPETIVKSWQRTRANVRGTINGKAFRGSFSKGEGVHRMVVKKAFLDELGVAKGAAVDVAMELDSEPRPLALPEELQALLAKDKTLAKQFEAMAPSHRRAWAAYIGEAKRPETRERRAEKARAGIRARVFPGQ